MITNDKIIKIFCATDEFSKKYEEEIENMTLQLHIITCIQLIPILYRKGDCSRGTADF